MEQGGQLVCIGTGMTLGAHLTPLSLSYLQQADVVFALMSHGVVEQWIQSLHPDVRSLQPYYQEGTDRRISYQRMIDAMLSEVRRGKKVVGAFYGHPGVFAYVPHQAILLAKQQGYSAWMEPGISAEACLIADLAIDPGRYGAQHYEATQWMIYQRQTDPTAYLMLWQVGVAGDLTTARFGTTEMRLQLLVDKLRQYYPADHQVILYEACTLPIGKPRTEYVALSELARCEIHLHTTLVIPPAFGLQEDSEMQQRLARLA